MALVFSETMTPFARGRRVNMEEWNTITRTFETGSNAQLAFGVPVRRGANAKGCVAITTGSAEVIGITEASQVLGHPGDYYLQYDSVAVCEVGVIGVVAGENVTAGAPAGYDSTANDGAGGWMVADTAVSQIPGAVFETSGSQGEVVALRYRRPSGI